MNTGADEATPHAPARGQGPAPGDPGGLVLVAGIGNLFLRDDGFGPEVVRRLADPPGLPPEARVVDYGIRGMHLAYDLLAGYAALVLVDACPGEGPPGTVTVLEVGPDDLGEGEFDAHGMNPVAVLANLGQLGGTLPPAFVVGCVPADLGEGIGLSAAVAAAVPEAAEAVRALLGRIRQGDAPPGAGRVCPPPSAPAARSAASEPRRA
ncbi:hydrogenase maturation protease [Streptomyces sp. NPDC047002]|uniref:hydrogenase maturation protease n=1 Tax=Streptomyces sp. NPDC047002 TaxID=3155475 RepID=UPI003453FE0A